MNHTTKTVLKWVSIAIGGPFLLLFITALCIAIFHKQTPAEVAQAKRDKFVVDSINSIRNIPYALTYKIIDDTKNDNNIYLAAVYTDSLHSKKQLIKTIENIKKDYANKNPDAKIFIRLFNNEKWAVDKEKQFAWVVQSGYLNKDYYKDDWIAYMTWDTTGDAKTINDGIENAKLLRKDKSIKFDSSERWDIAGIHLQFAETAKYYQDRGLDICTVYDLSNDMEENNEIIKYQKEHNISDLMWDRMRHIGHYACYQVL